MLPKSQDAPAGSNEDGIGVAITTNILFYLGAPPRPVRLWPCPVLRASVPKAAVDKDRQAGAHEDNICAAPASNYRPIDAETQAKSMNFATQGKLTGSISPRGDLHPVADRN
jgi:hypothetical protein